MKRAAVLSSAFIQREPSTPATISALGEAALALLFPIAPQLTEIL